MNMQTETVIGLAAAFCTTFAYLPQVTKAWVTRSTKDISTITFGFLVTGIALWLTYGILIGDLPLILSNAVTLIFTGTVLYLKLRYG